MSKPAGFLPVDCLNSNKDSTKIKRTYFQVEMEDADDGDSTEVRDEASNGGTKAEEDEDEDLSSGLVRSKWDTEARKEKLGRVVIRFCIWM